MISVRSLLTPSEADKALVKSLDFRAPSVWLATAFGLGFLRPGPGTWGSLGALALALPIVFLMGQPGFLAAIGVVVALGFWAARRFQTMTGVHDSKMVVIDEVAGQWIALWPVLTAPVIQPAMIAAAFVLFRVLDILKPWPVSFFDKKVEGAAGVMGDDIAAGLIAALALWGFEYARSG